MFHQFTTKEERRIFGGSAFIELQYCKMSRNTKIARILSLKNAKHWEDDSLYIYVDDFDLFFDNYTEILNNATYNNLKKGPFDMYGYNYYEPSQVIIMIDKIKEEQPMHFKKILEWLEYAKVYNGFYLIGI